MKDPAIELRDVRMQYPNAEQPVLDGVSLQVACGEAAAVIGPSGSGKSSLLRCITLLEPVMSGEVFVSGDLVQRGRPDDGVPSQKRASRKGRPRQWEDAEVFVDEATLRQRVGLVFQSFNLWPHLTVERNLMEAPILVRRIPREEARRSAHRLLEEVGIADKAPAYPNELSGGQQQRAAIARALAMEPEILLFDEITSALDPETVSEVLTTIETVRERDGMSMVVVTHHMGFAERIAQRTHFLDQGRIVESGPSRSVLGQPKSPRLQRFLAKLDLAH